MKVEKRIDEDINNLLRRFRKSCQDDGVIKSYKDHEYWQGTKRFRKKQKRLKTMRRVRKHGLLD